MSNGWLWRAVFPVICGCCGNLVTSCYERGHDKACVNCRDHFWLNGSRGDKPCNVANLVDGLSGKNGSPYEKALELKAIHGPACEYMHTPMGKMPPRGPERDALCDCGYIQTRRKQQALEGE